MPLPPCKLLFIKQWNHADAAGSSGVNHIKLSDFFSETLSPVFATGREDWPALEKYSAGRRGGG